MPWWRGAPSNPSVGNLRRKPLFVAIERIVVGVPGAGEVRVRMLSTSICHTDLYTLSGQDPEGKFPVILGHEGLGVVESVGEGVEDLQVGDPVIPLYIPECGQCRFCRHPSGTNLCSVIRETQGKGVMPDGTSRFRLKMEGTNKEGQNVPKAEMKDGTARNAKGGQLLNGELHHFMGCSTWAEYTVMPRISLCKVEQTDARLCLMGCGVTTGWGAACQVAQVQPGDQCLVIGLGGVGLSVIQGLRSRGAGMIIGVDLDERKFALAKAMGATHLLSDTTDLAAKVVAMTGGGVEWSFECVGNTGLMRAALEAGHKGWGTCIIIGVAASGQEISTRPFQLVTGRTWKRCAFGGIKGRTQLPDLVNQAQRGEIQLDPLITQTYSGGVQGIVQAMAAGSDALVIRPLITY